LFFRIKNEATPIAEVIMRLIQVIEFIPKRFKADCVAGTITVNDANAAIS